MPPPRKGIQKLFYSTEEMAQRYDVDKSKITYYKDKFELSIKQRGDKNNELLFTERDIQIFDRIFQLVDVEKYTIEGAKIQLRKRMDAVDMRDEMLEKLNYLKETLLKIEKEI
jgi:DNA-binding transcriptional MerR regulator